MIFPRNPFSLPCSHLTLCPFNSSQVALRIHYIYLGMKSPRLTANPHVKKPSLSHLYIWFSPFTSACCFSLKTKRVFIGGGFTENSEKQFWALRFVVMGCCFSARIKAESPPRKARNSSHDSKEEDGLMGGSSKFSTSSVPPTPRTEGEILQSSNLKKFTYNELRTATRNFRPDSMVGEGGFGGVFKGWLDEQTLAPAKPSTGIVIAVKKLNQEGFQGHNEWLTEINFLGQLHHPNLVKLIGYCLEDEHRLLVYEFLTKGSLDNHLFRRTSHVEPLSWSNRMKIALDAAKGLAFLHSDGVKVIYRDLKASNILLDSNFNAKLSDFGLAKDGPSDDKSHVSTRVMGTYGYAAPEYMATGHLTKKSDVYTFGVVLLEIMSGKRALDRNRTAREQNLVEWAKPYISSKRRIFQVMDARIEGQYLVREAMKVAKITIQCLSVEPRFRPTMADVVRALEQLQDPSDAGSSTGSSSSNVPKQHKRSTNESLNGAATSEPRSSASHST